MKKHFNKNLIMTEKEEHLFQQSNNFWICKKLIDNVMIEKLEIIVTLQVNSEEQQIGVVA